MRGSEQSMRRGWVGGGRAGFGPSYGDCAYHQEKGRSGATPESFKFERLAAGLEFRFRLLYPDCNCTGPPRLLPPCRCLPHPYHAIHIISTRIILALQYASCMDGCCGMGPGLISDVDWCHSRLFSIFWSVWTVVSARFERCESGR